MIPVRAALPRLACTTIPAWGRTVARSRPSSTSVGTAHIRAHAIDAPVGEQVGGQRAGRRRITAGCPLLSDDELDAGLVGNNLRAPRRGVAPPAKPEATLTTSAYARHSSPARVLTSSADDGDPLGAAQPAERLRRLGEGAGTWARVVAWPTRPRGRRATRDGGEGGPTDACLRGSHDPQRLLICAESALRRAPHRESGHSIPFVNADPALELHDLALGDRSPRCRRSRAPARRAPSGASSLPSGDDRLSNFS